MCNYEPSAGISQGYCLNSMVPQEGNISLSNSTNRYVYVKQNFINPSHVEQKTVMSKVLVNPHFNKTVFVNPNFNLNTTLVTTSVPKIHVNPRIQKLNVNVKDCASVQKIHINPNVLRNIPVTLNNPSNPENGTSEVRRNYEPMKDANSSVFCTKAGLVCSPVKHTTMENKSRKRRSSVRSKFKIIKSSILENSLNNKNIKKRRASLRSRYKIIKSTCTSENGPETSSKNHEPLVSKFKVDNRDSTKALALLHRNRKYVYVNRFLSISDIARTKLLKQNMGIKKLSLINISGILYKKSPNSLKRTSGSFKKMDDMKKAEENTPTRSKFKFIKKSNKKPNENTPLKQYKVLRVKKIKKMFPGKLRKCNIPCPYYRKFGKCKGKENGKCYRKHDPDQIALCTKFLQGACVDKKCLLSHNVSPEKMPTCKFYLEGSCSRDDCPYLHVRISPKADICKDFLEGFCKNASQCDKRHQFLCPDYEKNGTCLKQRCPYPHGKMVRKYSVFSKNKFAKKSSDDCKKETKSYKSKENVVLISTDPPSSNFENFKSNIEVNFKSRYYIEQNITVREDKLQEASTSDQNNSNNDEINCDQESGVRSRPKLGKLPSFIAFEEVQ